MPNVADLEISVRGKVADNAYPIELRFVPADKDVDYRFPDSGRVLAKFDLDVLPDPKFDPDAYGAQLGKMLFADPLLAAKIDEFQKLTDALTDAVLRVQLFIDRDASELQSLSWEAIRDASGAPMFLGQRTWFSRYLESDHWQAANLRPQQDLKALVIIANPSDSGLTLMNVDEEKQKAESYLNDFAATTYLRPPTLSNLIASLQAGNFDLIYVIAHGAVIKGDPRLWLEKPDGTTDIVSASALVDTILGLTNLPRLIVLASCQSAGGTADADGGVMGALGPHLARAGVPAVVAMHGKVSMQTVAEFMPPFFAELRKDGQIDRAMSVARSRVSSSRNDFWMPILFSRLRSGRIWYNPGFDGSANDFDQWKPIVDIVNSGQCVPILGPNLASHWIGDTHDVAASIAADNGFPLSASDCRDMAKVMQFVTIRSSADAARTQARTGFLMQMRGAVKAAPDADPGSIIQSVLTTASSDEADPLRIVADMNAKLFINAAADPLFEGILKQRGKQPVPVVTGWRDERRRTAAGQEHLEDPTVAKPLLYYVFGKSSDEDTWVLTEDDVYDYLIQITRYNLMPTLIRSSLTDGSLFFLGFPLDDWKFRVLFRLILSIPGSSNLTKFNHVGVQVNPNEASLENAKRARNYLKSYFMKPNPLDQTGCDPKIDIYWGTSTDFLRQLAEEMKKQPKAKGASVKW